MINANLNSCLSFINSQAASTSSGVAVKQVRRAVTLSRQAGCGAVTVAEKLGNFLEDRVPSPEAKWTVFDRELMKKVLEDHHLPGFLDKVLSEDRVSFIHDCLADIFNVHPTANTMVKLVSETVLQLAEIGNVIIIGRGANIVTAKLPYVLHVRLVAQMEDRIERICKLHNKTPDQARYFCLEEDSARARYMKTYFNADIDDPLNYHMIINTSRVNCDLAARMIGETLLKMA